MFTTAKELGYTQFKPLYRQPTVRGFPKQNRNWLALLIKKGKSPYFTNQVFLPVPTAQCSRNFILQTIYVGNGIETVHYQLWQMNLHRVNSIAAALFEKPEGN